MTVRGDKHPDANLKGCLIVAAITGLSRTFLILCALVGCSGDALPTKDYDSTAVAEAALRAFDANLDGQLAEDELNACPALQSALPRVDANQDGQLDATEIADRIASYANMSNYIVADVVVRRGRQPLAGARVTLKLAEFMGVGDTTFSATTDVTGIGAPTSAPQELLGFPPGFYDVEVVHEGATKGFGVELADDAPGANRLQFDLRE